MRAAFLAFVLSCCAILFAEDRADRFPSWDSVLIASFNTGAGADRSYIAATPTLFGDASVSTSLALDGTGDYMTYPDNSAYSFTNGAGVDQPFTVCAWVNLTSVSAAFRTAVGKGASGSLEWQLFATANSASYKGFSLGLYNPSGSAQIVVGESSSTISSGTWYHIAATYSGSESAAGIKVYRDGVALSTTALTIGSYTGMTNGTNPVSVGAMSGPLNLLAGSVDGVRIFSRELSANEIAAIYSEGRR